MRRMMVLTALLLVLSPLPSANAEPADGTDSATAPPPRGAGPGESLTPTAPTPLPSPAVAGTPMTLAACVREAYARHPDLEGSHVALSRSEDEARAVRGGFLPKITVEGNVLVWDDEMTTSFGGGEALPMPTGPGPDQLPESGFDLYVADQLAGLGELLGSFGDLSSMKMRDQVTWGVTVRATQPVTPLYQIVEGHRARLAQAEGARAHVATVRQDIALRVATAYYAALQADAYVTIADSAVEQLEAHRAQVKRFHAEGLIGYNDVLKVNVELANARQQRIEAAAGRAIAQANLAVEMGRPPNQPVVPTPQPPRDEVSEPAVSVDEAMAAAERHRTELQEIDHGHEAAGHAAKAAWADLIPQVALVAQYDHMAGQGAFALEDTFFAGLMLSWDVWDWGTTIYEARAADARAEELRLRRERTAQLVQLEATAKLYRLRSAAEAFRVARETIDQAEEALRIERERFSARTATTTDVLDAEAGLTRARANLANTWYAWLLARTELDRAMGRTAATMELDG